ncbi:MAG: glycosyltransferase family 2 protein [Bacilli bacterium]
MKKKLSIIIPVYNTEKYIEKCINSILNQSSNEIEIIVVNDGSKDNSLQILNKYKKTIKIFSKENGGLSSARNFGLEHASGQYIWFIDGDDYIEEGSIEIILSIIGKKDYDIISFNYNKDYENSKQKIRENHNINNKEKILINTSACTKVFKKSFLEENNITFDEGIIYEDLALIPYLFSITDSIIHIDKYLYNYVYRNGSIMNNKEFKLNVDDKFIAINNLIKRIEKKGIKDKYEKEIEYLIIKHIIFTYTSEIFKYKKNIYFSRCDRALKYVNEYNKNWLNNDYLKKEFFGKKIYCLAFKNRFYFLCKCITIALKKVGKI